MFAYQNPRRLLLLCIGIADIAATTCGQLCQHGSANDRRHPVSVAVELIVDGKCSASE